MSWTCSWPQWGKHAGSYNHRSGFRLCTLSTPCVTRPKQSQRCYRAGGRARPQPPQALLSQNIQSLHESLNTEERVNLESPVLCFQVWRDTDRTEGFASVRVLVSVHGDVQDDWVLHAQNEIFFLHQTTLKLCNTVHKKPPRWYTVTVQSLW